MASLPTREVSMEQACDTSHFLLTRVKSSHFGWWPSQVNKNSDSSQVKSFSTADSSQVKLFQQHNRIKSSFKPNHIAIWVTHVKSALEMMYFVQNWFWYAYRLTKTNRFGIAFYSAGAKHTTQFMYLVISHVLTRVIWNHSASQKQVKSFFVDSSQVKSAKSTTRVKSSQVTDLSHHNPV